MDLVSWLYSNYTLQLRITSRCPISCAVNLRLNTHNIRASIGIRPTRALHINVLNFDVGARGRAGADDVPDKRVVLFAGGAGEVLD